jgi:hypothetical protein
MSTAYQPYAPGQIVAGYGYRQLAGAAATETAELPTLVCAGIGVALGILVGTALAGSAWLTNTPVAPPSLARVNSSAAVSISHPAAYAGQTSPLERQADNQENKQLSSPLQSTAVTASAAHKVSAVHGQNAVRTVSAGSKSSAGRKASSMRRSFVSSRAPAPDALPPASQVASLDDAAEPMSFTIEGDVTVADYDASQGTIATQEGKTFVIDRTVGESYMAPWQEYRANLHYRCDQGGNCTLFRAGVAVPNAKLSL